MLFDKIINTVFSFGAAVVIFGAWGKIEHKEFGSIALTAGLLTETAIFCIYGLLEWRKKGEAAPAAEDPQGMLADRRVGLADPRAGSGDHADGSVDRRAGSGQPVGSSVEPEQVEALTDSIRQASQVLTRIFRL